MFPTVFEKGYGEYNESIDIWLWYPLMYLTSERTVVMLDGMWQYLIKSVLMADIQMDQYDATSNTRCKPHFTAMLNGVLIMKGEMTAQSIDMIAARVGLLKKFHSSAYKLFPTGCSSIPAVITSIEQVQLLSLSYDVNNRKHYSLSLVKAYNVMEMAPRVEFICDIFRILIWALSHDHYHQQESNNTFHLSPGVRTRTRNGHFITFLAGGICKEFGHHRLSQIDMDVIRVIYSLKLPNVEWGIVNDDDNGGHHPPPSSITITRVGSTLTHLGGSRGGGSRIRREDIFEQVSRGVEQLHAHGFAHCDICVDNIFIDDGDSEGGGGGGGGQAFLGDLEYCCGKDSKPRSDIRRADDRARTSEELDNIQLVKLKDELARL
eukprot:gene36809-48004_t